MVRRYRPRYRQKPSPHTRYRINEAILSPTLRVIDEQGENLGVMSRQEALARTRSSDLNLDLIEVSPKSEPPVCRIMSFGKFKYDTEKKLKAQKVSQKKNLVKGIRLSARIQEHDRAVKRHQALEFLEDGNQVKIEINLKGRERRMGEQARMVVQNFVTSLGEGIQTLSPLTKMGSKVTVLVMKK